MTMDMECFDDLLSRPGLQPDHHLLDLGCGAGGLSEYIFDRLGILIEHRLKGDADEDYLPSVKAGLINRYLYQVYVD